MSDGGGVLVFLSLILGIVVGGLVMLSCNTVNTDEVKACYYACNGNGGLDTINGWGVCWCKSGAKIENAKIPESTQETSKDSD